MPKQVLDVHQMQHLQELGLELKDTMLYWIKPLDAVIGIVVGLENDWQLDFIDDKKRKYLKYIPAYTLQDVLDALPGCLEIGGTEYEITIYMINCKWAVDYCSEKGADIQSGECENLIDAAYSRLCWCIENGYVETKKTNEV